jgi:signal transduction histidine kinase
MSSSGGDRKRVRRNPRLVWRLFAAMTLVVAAGALTLLVVAVLVAPRVFHSHLKMVNHPLSADVQTHVDEAFAQAVLLSLGVGVLVALVATLAVTWLVSRRVADPITAVSEAAGRVAAGDLTARVPTPGLGRELTELADSFNTMTSRLATTERTRQQLIADLAHELRNPLASLQATLEATADGVVPTDASTWTTLLEQSARLQRLVDDMSAVSKAEERQLDLHPVPVDAAELARDATAVAQAQYDAAGVTLSVAIDGEAPGVTVDSDRIGEVLANLLSNALRHTHAGNHVTVHVTTEADTVRLDVTDTGDGFTPAGADRLFERFYRGDTSRSRDSAGSGIGLTIARAIITAHRGTLRAHSDGPGHGATFTIRLPRTRNTSTH